MGRHLRASYRKPRTAQKSPTNGHFPQDSEEDAQSDKTSRKNSAIEESERLQSLKSYYIEEKFQTNHSANHVQVTSSATKEEEYTSGNPKGRDRDSNIIHSFHTRILNCEDIYSQENDWSNVDEKRATSPLSNNLGVDNWGQTS